MDTVMSKEALNHLVVDLAGIEWDSQLVA